MREALRKAASGREIRFSRRQMAAGVGTVGSLAAIGWGLRHPDLLHAQDVTPTNQDGTGVDGPDQAASPAFGTPSASPAASPVSSQLEIVRAPFPVDSGSAASGGTLRLTIAATAGSFNPTSGDQDSQFTASYLDPLLRVDPVTMEPTPGLARSWTWSDDGSAITFFLRGDATWHDGTPFTRDDVIFCFLAYRDDTSSAYSRFFTEIRGIETVGKQRLRIRFSKPDGTFLFNASTLPIFQKRQYQDYWERQPTGARTLDGFDWEKSPPVGTGPWIVDSWRDRRIDLVRNEDYWSEPPHTDRLELSTFEDDEARVQRWRGGVADVVWPVSPTVVPTLTSEPGRLYVADAASVMFAAFNFSNPAAAAPGVFDDVRVRSALSSAIDREHYADEVFGGYIRYDQAGTIAQPWAHDDEITNPEYNPGAAQKLLENAGWTDLNGDGILDDSNGYPLSLVAILETGVSPELEATMRSVAADFAEIGVSLEVLPLDPISFAQRWQVSHEFDLIAYHYRLYPGFSDFDLYGSDWDIRTNAQGWNPGGYHNSRVDSLINQILQETDPTKQRELLVRLQKETNEDLFGLWLGFPQDLILVSPNVRGFQPNVNWQTADTRSIWFVDESSD